MQAEQDIVTVEHLFQFMSQRQPGTIVSMKNKMLPLTSSWPSSGGACMLRSLMRTEVDAQWMPESKLRSMVNVVEASDVCGVVDKAVLHLGVCGCIVVGCASSLNLYNVTIEGVALGHDSGFPLSRVLLRYTCNIMYMVSLGIATFTRNRSRSRSSV